MCADTRVNLVFLNYKKNKSSTLILIFNETKRKDSYQSC